MIIVKELNILTKLRQLEFQQTKLKSDNHDYYLLNININEMFVNIQVFNKKNQLVTQTFEQNLAPTKPVRKCSAHRSMFVARFNGYFPFDDTVNRRRHRKQPVLEWK
jgi:hypothetical protein